jgi:ubiquinone/menaquinone biosynthesis C-methylase UbiE
MMTTTSQQSLDERNAAFWDELCGTIFAQSLGIVDHSVESLRRFDNAYMEMYPYLPGQLPVPSRPGASLLEVGLGFGTVSQKLAEVGFRYHGLDIAPGPVEMVRARLRMLGEQDADDRVVLGSALDIPHPDASFDHVVSIGCLHHTGDLPLAVREVRRVLKPGGTAMVMLYNRHSLRQLKLRMDSLGRRLKGTTADDDETIRAAYDANIAGEAAPEVVFVTARQIRDDLFAEFSAVHVERHNFDDSTTLVPLLGRTLSLPRYLALPTIARLVGLDLYITARK